MERRRRRKNLLVISRCSIYDLPLLFYQRTEFGLDDDSSNHRAGSYMCCTYGDVVSIVNDTRAPLSPFLLLMSDVLLWKVQQDYVFSLSQDKYYS